MAKELEQTRGSVRIEGVVVGFDPTNENTYREGETKSGQPYRSISVAIKTSPNNVIYNLDLFGQYPNKPVKIFSNKGGEKKQLEIDFDDRHDLPEGFTPLGFGTVGTGFEKNEKGSVKIKNYFNYDGVEVLKNNLENGMSVWVDADFNINTYTSNGEEKSIVKYTINRIGLHKEPVDFDSENFKEVASYEQEFVVTNNQYDKETKKLYVGARIIEWNKTWKDIVLVVDANKYEKLAQNIYKKTKFGDLLTVQGVIRNGTEVVEVDDPEELDWGGEKPEGQRKKVNKNKISEIQITNVIKHVPKAYKEDDFIVEESPFGSDTNADDPLSFDDEDLPF